MNLKEVLIIILLDLALVKEKKINDKNIIICYFSK